MGWWHKRHPVGSRVQVSKRLLLINSASSVLRRILYVSVLLWVNQYLLRRIGSDEYSLYPLAMTVAFVVPLLSLFLTAGLARFVTEAYALGDDEKITSIVSTMSVSLLVLAIVCLAGGLVFSWHVGRVLTIPAGCLWDARVMFGLLVISTAMRLPLAPFEFGLYVKQKFVLQNLIGLFVEAVKVVLLFVLLFGVSTRILWVVVVEVITQSLSTAIMVAVSLKEVPSMRFSRQRIDWGIARQIMGFGGWSLVINTAWLAQRMLDPVFLNKLARLSDVTSYHFATMPVRHIRGFSAVATAPLLPQLIAMHAAGRREQMQRLYLRGGRYGLWAVLGITLPAMVYCRELVALYMGPKYIGTAFVMLVALATVSWGYSNWVLAPLCQAKDEMRPMAVRTAVLQVLRIGLILLFVGSWHMGALGMAIAGLVAAAAGMAINVPLGWRLTEIKPRLWFREVFVKGNIPGAVALSVWLGLEILRPPSTWVMVGLYVSAGLLVYLLVLVFHSFDDYERTYCRKAISGIVARYRALRTRGTSPSASSSGTSSD